MEKANKEKYLLDNGWVTHWSDHNWILLSDFQDREIPDNAGCSLDVAFASQKLMEESWVQLGWYKDENGVWKESTIINKYPYGSRVYGSHNKESDYDFVVVVEEYYKNMDINTHVYTVNDFQTALDNHDVPALECYFLPDSMIIKNNHKFSFTLNKFKLRRSISTISSNAFVRGKKKLCIAGDYDKKLGIKSIFHSLRILDYGIQIANNGKIVDYSSSNWILKDLYEITKDLENVSAWKSIEDKYKKIYNDRATKFKSLCPKLNHNTLNQLLTDIVKKYNVEKPGKLVNELEALFNTYDNNKGIDLDLEYNKKISEDGK